MKWLHWYFHRKALYYKIIIAVFLTKISPKQDFMVNHAYFFYFVTWISLIFLMISGVFTDIFWEQKIENLGWYSWNQTKKNWNFSGTPLGPRASVRRFAAFSGPRAQRGAREVSIYFFVWFHETTQGFNFCSQKISVKPLKPSKKSMKPGHKKKMRGFLLKPANNLNDTAKTVE